MLSSSLKKWWSSGISLCCYHTLLKIWMPGRTEKRFPEWYLKRTDFGSPKNLSVYGSLKETLFLISKKKLLCNGNLSWTLKVLPRNIHRTKKSFGPTNKYSYSSQLWMLMHQQLQILKDIYSTRRSWIYQ